MDLLFARERTDETRVRGLARRIAVSCAGELPVGLTSAMTDFEDLAAKVCKRPGMFVGCDSFAAVCAYLHGFDVARDEGPLLGFHPWMVLRQGSGSNVAWEGLVLAEAIGPMPGSDIAALSPEENRRCVQKLGELLAEFFEDRRRRSVTGILHDYAKWLLRKKWYDGPLRRE